MYTAAMTIPPRARVPHGVNLWAFCNGLYSCVTNADRNIARVARLVRTNERGFLSWVCRTLRALPPRRRLLRWRLPAVFYTAKLCVCDKRIYFIHPSHRMYKATLARNLERRRLCVIAFDFISKAMQHPQQSSLYTSYWFSPRENGRLLPPLPPLLPSSLHP